MYHYRTTRASKRTHNRLIHAILCGYLPLCFDLMHRTHEPARSQRSSYMSLSAHVLRSAEAYRGAMSGVSVLLVVALLITRAATAQVFQTLTPTPLVTGATAAWQLR